ncbi:UbiH/UbiF/VisC/COQ6 family ubiquinone biosynthesis hydroxylase [Pseudomonas sp.]|uniref:UbiH/UbiF/VisC/COQ6 family ubiquinone biosynthesis hydroxylase n=1 Tax=Pseudomonas sp. TaxID=306 RepID=UPI00356A6F3E
MVGAAQAAALGQAGFRVALIEVRQPPPFDPAAEVDLRVSAISGGSQQFLASIKAWDAIARQRISAYESMQVWEQTGAGELSFSAADSGLASLGHIVENSLIIDALWQQLDTVEVICPARIAGLNLEESSAEIKLEEGRVLTSQLVIAADGGNSVTRELAGIGCYGWSYQQRGIVAHVQTQQPHQATAWQRFLPTGPLALLPLADGRCSIVWSASDALATELLDLDDAAFGQRLTEALEGRLGEVSVTSQRAAFPLRMQQAEAYCAPRLALVGDAAHVIHPLAGQGVNLGFGDAAHLLEVLQQTRQAGRDLGEHRRLRRYERARKAEDALMATATDGLNRLYASDNPLIQLGRRQGSRLVNLLTPLKSALIQQAAG